MDPSRIVDHTPRTKSICERNIYVEEMNEGKKERIIGLSKTSAVIVLHG